MDQKNIFLWNLIQVSKETYNNIPELINITHTELSIYGKNKIYLNPFNLFFKATSDDITQTSDQIVTDIEDSKKKKKKKKSF